MKRNHRLFGPLCAIAIASAAAGQQSVSPADARAKLAAGASKDFEFGGQVTLIGQYEPPFHSPYVGTNSFLSRRQASLSDTYTLYFGKRVSPRLEVYLNAEMARGGGLSNALGLAGFVNGDVIRNPTIGQDPYVARAMVRWTTPTRHGGGTEHVDETENQIAGDRPTHRLVITAGKMGSNDLFDTNSYANSTRTQFMNWDLLNNAAYDYAADTRGYTLGTAVEWYDPKFVVRFGSFQMPLVANGPDLNGNLARAHGDQIELELHPNLIRKEPAVVRLLAYRNVADMGNYRASLALAAQSRTVPDITATRQPGAVKFGFGLNAEQALGDGGVTGLFARLGWNDGATESFAYTEAETTYCIGAQVSGVHWKQPTDRFAVALVANGLSNAHRDYLAAGGLGFLLGDGKLRYGMEELVEAYYTRQLSKAVGLTLDVQGIQNPGYNRDRGPVPVIGLRVHVEF
ncbi:MAG: carbohydrate porin [Fimbriimonadaceae bacterium]